MSGLEQKFVCSVYSGKNRVWKDDCKGQTFALVSQDHFSAEFLYYLVKRNSVKYNVSEVSESFSLWESKKKKKRKKENIDN